MASSDASDGASAITASASASSVAASGAVSNSPISPQRQTIAAAAVDEFRALVDEGVQPAADADAAAAAVGDLALLPEIERLKAEQKRIRSEREKVRKDLKNAEKRRSRLKRKAKQLSDGDLLQVMQMRTAEKAARTSADPSASEGGASSSGRAQGE